MRLAAAILCLLTATAIQALDCAASLEHLGYPRLARIASVSGSVQVSFTVGVSGNAGTLETQGHSLLIHDLVRQINNTNFPAHCREKRMDIAVDFLLAGEAADTAHTTVSFPSPGHIEITSNPTGIICMLTSEATPPPSRLRRLLRTFTLRPIQ